MQLGWIDFSDKDKQKALEVLKMGQIQGTIDELGIGVIRDAFSNYFFPGTSTVQTRAKYFFLVPYIIHEECDNTKNTSRQAIRNAIDNHERSCAISLLRKKDNDGVIGANVLPDKWVKRRPSEIYWNGIKTYGIIKGDYTIDECISISLRLRQMKEKYKNGGKLRENDDESDNDDSLSQSGVTQIWNIPSAGYGDWEDNLSIELTPEEAQFLRIQINNTVSDSLLNYLLDNNINVNEIDDFSSLNKSLQNKNNISDVNKDILYLADWFSKLCYVTRIAYNMIIGTVGAKDEWEHRPQFDSQLLLLEGKQNIARIYDNLKIPVNSHNLKTKYYLTKVIDSVAHNDMEELFKTIKDREVSLKGRERAKTLHTEDYEGGDAWLGGRELDYRLSQAKRMINDIYQGEEQNA